MKIGKIAAAAAVIAVCAALLASCGKDNSDEAVTPAESDSETATSAEQTSDTSESHSESETESETAADGVNEDTDTDISDAISGNALMPIADAALGAGEWPSMWEVSDPDLLNEYFLLDWTNSNYRNLLVLQCPMSANMTEIVIIEAEDVSAARTDLEARQKKAREQDAFYPADVERAGASVVGTEGDYAYFIMSDNVSDAEKAVTDYIKAM